MTRNSGLHNETYKCFYGSSSAVRTAKILATITITNNNNNSNSNYNLAFGMCTFIKAKRRFINFAVVVVVAAWLVLCGKLVF